MHHIVFLNGLGGTGKSTLVRHFIEHPIPNWSFYDFDYGKYPSDNKPLMEKVGKDWRELQTKWWLKAAKAHSKTHSTNLLIAGVSEFPWKMIKYPEYNALDAHTVHFGFLSISQEERKKRLTERGAADLWKPEKLEEYKTIQEKAIKFGAKEFPIEGLETQEVAAQISTWLQTLETSQPKK